MARTYYVKRAQQRYHTKPVLDENGQPKRSPKMRHGVQMATKSGRPIFMDVTERDLDRPKPMPKCSKCGNVVQVGQPYKYTETYNRTIVRCGTCPAPQVWEYSDSLSARTALIQHEADEAIDGITDLDSAEAARDQIASAVRELSEEKETSADNMEEGFGHETEQSNELRDIAEQLGSWADEIEGTDFPEYPDPEPEPCEECNGTGHVEDDEYCPDCDGQGETTPDDPSEEQMDEWAEEARDALREQVSSCPV